MLKRALFSTAFIEGRIFTLLILLFFSTMSVLAIPIRLTIQPKSTNQVELAFGPVVPHAAYEVLARANGLDGHWVKFAGVFFSGNNQTITATCNLGGIRGLTLRTLNDWKFAAGRWDDAEYEIPPLYKELVLLADPFSYIDPNGILPDGWSNIQQFQLNLDPSRWYPPPNPQPKVSFGGRRAFLTWQVFNNPAPDYFLIERADRTMPSSITNNPHFVRPPLGAHFGANYPPNFYSPYGRQSRPREGSLITGRFEVVARVQGQPGVHSYQYVDANVDLWFQPLYRIQAHYPPASHAHLVQVDAAAIRKTIRSVTARQTTNGYDLTVLRPTPHTWYLLLVRDKNNPQWRASGYFISGTNRNPVYLRVDKKGMMSDGQAPVAMPSVKFLPDVVKPEFIAGWGSDSDGDGLPDIYEVLVTHTEPNNADTGNTGILDGYKEMTDDGWDNLEKFRRRIDPLRPAQPPATVELKQPTEREIMQAISPKSDLRCELEIEIRTNGTADYQPIEKVPWMFSKIMNFRQPNERRNFDLRVSWHFPEPRPNEPDGHSYSDMPAAYPAIEAIEARVNLQLFQTFSNNLAINPPLSRSAMSNEMATLMQSYRQGEMDKGLAMAEFMILANNQSQDFYGKVIDQYGQPVVGADVTAQVNLAMGRGGAQKTKTDAAGLFQFIGLRGQSLSIMPEKMGFQIEGHGLGLKGLDGSETSPNHRAIYTMWKLKGAEPMIHKEISSRKIQPDGRTYTIDFLKDKITEGTNAAGDLFVRIQRPPQVKPRDKYDWSFTMTAIDGGFIEVTNDDYLNEAPESGYQQQYQMNRYATNVVNYSTYSLYRTDRTFFLKSRGGQVYGHFHIMDLDPDYRGMAALQIEYYINPSGSRNLEFDPAKQIQ